MIVDCFTFFNEFDVLELRLRTLEDVVDRFVLCEAPFTFRGVPKPLYFATERDRFTRWLDRLTVLTYDGPPSENPWENEWGQRDFLATALATCAPDDLVLIGDCDEIPNPELVSRRPAHGAILGHRMIFAQGYVNRVVESGAPCWFGTRAATVETIARFGGPSNVRKHPVGALEVVDSGWHFTSLGGAGVMEQKMRAYSHAEYDIPYLRDLRRLEVSVEGMAPGMWVPLDDRFPRPLLDDPRWQRFVWEQQVSWDITRLRDLEHAHGCCAYVPPAAPAVAVLAKEPGAWHEVGESRFGSAFAGVFSDVRGILGVVDRGGWVVADRLARQPRGALTALGAAGLRVVAYVENARSLEVFQRVLSGVGLFPAGRALGPAEYMDEIREAGYDVAAVDRVYNKISIPREIAPSYAVTIGSFAFPQLTPDALYDFLTNAFVYTLTPPAGVEFLNPAPS